MYYLECLIIAIILTVIIFKSSRCTENSSMPIFCCNLFLKALGIILSWINLTILIIYILKNIVQNNNFDSMYENIFGNKNNILTALMILFIIAFGFYIIYMILFQKYEERIQSNIMYSFIFKLYILDIIILLAGAIIFLLFNTNIIIFIGFTLSLILLICVLRYYSSMKDLSKNNNDLYIIAKMFFNNNYYITMRSGDIDVPYKDPTTEEELNANYIYSLNQLNNLIEKLKPDNIYYIDINEKILNILNNRENRNQIKIIKNKKSYGRAFNINTYKKIFGNNLNNTKYNYNFNDVYSIKFKILGKEN